jgi:hypothetical protein
MAEGRSKIESVTIDLNKVAQESSKEFQSMINSYAALQELLKNSDPTTIKSVLGTTHVGEFLKGMVDSGKSVEELFKQFDHLKKTYKDIDVLQKSSGQNYQEAAKQAKLIYESTLKQSTELDKVKAKEEAGISRSIEKLKKQKEHNDLLVKELASREKLSKEEATALTALKDQLKEHDKKIKSRETELSLVSKKLVAIQANTSAMKKQSEMADVLAKQQAELNKKALADIEKQKQEHLSLAKVLSEKFGKTAGSGALGALMGNRESGNIGHLLLANIGEKTGIAGSLQESKLARMMAKGFDTSELNQKTATSSERTADLQFQFGKETKDANSKAMGALGILGLATVGTGIAAHSVTGAGIRGVAKVVDGVQGLKDPLGMEKLLFGKIGGGVVGKMFGKETGNAFSGIVGQLMDALTYSLQRDWESASYYKGVKRQGATRMSLFGVEKSGAMTKEEFQGIGNKYSRMGRRMGGLKDYMNLQAAEQEMGEDVMTSGYETAAKSTTSQVEIAKRLAKTFEDVTKSAHRVGASIQGITKELLQSAEAARFLNVDIRGVSAVYQSLFAKQGKELMAAGINVRNPGQALTNIMGMAKDDPAADIFLQGDMTGKYRSTEEAIMGHYFSAINNGIKKYDFTGKTGWGIAGGTFDSDMKAMKKDGVEYMINKLVNAKDFALKAGGDGPMGVTSIMAAKQVLGLSTEEAKIFLHRDSLSGSNKKAMMDLVEAAGEDPKVHIRHTATSAAKMAGLQANTVQILINILALLIAMPKVIAASFGILSDTETKKVMGVWHSNNNSMMGSLKTIENITPGALNPVKGAINLYGDTPEDREVKKLKDIQYNAAKKYSKDRTGKDIALDVITFGKHGADIIDKTVDADVSRDKATDFNQQPAKVEASSTEENVQSSRSMSNDKKTVNIYFQVEGSLFADQKALANLMSTAENSFKV